MYSFITRLCLLLALLAQADTVGAAQNTKNCDIQNELFAMLTESQSFLDFLDTGEPANAPAQLRAHLIQTTPERFQEKLAATGISKAGASAANLIRDQRKILETYRNYGREQARMQASHLQARTQIDRFRSDIAPLPCDETQRNSPKGAAPLGKSAPLPIGEISVYTTLGLLLLASLFKLIESRDKANKRRSKRYPCALACIIQLSAAIEQAQLVDVSRVGAKVKLKGECTPGDTMQIAISGKQIAARVVWQNSNYAGVTFRKRLSASGLKQILNSERA